MAWAFMDRSFDWDAQLLDDHHAGHARVEVAMVRLRSQRVKANVCLASPFDETGPPEVGTLVRRHGMGNAILVVEGDGAASIEGEVRRLVLEGLDDHAHRRGDLPRSSRRNFRR